MRLIVGFFLFTVFMVSTAFKPAFADVNPPTINGNWLIDIRTLCAVMGTVLFGTWWIAKWMQRVEDRLKGGEVRFTALELKAQDREDILLNIKGQMDRLVDRKDRERDKVR